MEGKAVRRRCGLLQQELLQKGKLILVANDDGEGHGRRYGLKIKGGGAEASFADGVGHGSIEKLVGRFDDLNILRLAVFIDVEGEDNFCVEGKSISLGGGESDVG